jgi:hypothetical protein
VLRLRLATNSDPCRPPTDDMSEQFDPAKNHGRRKAPESGIAWAQGCCVRECRHSAHNGSLASAQSSAFTRASERAAERRDEEGKPPCAGRVRGGGAAVRASRAGTDYHPIGGQ